MPFHYAVSEKLTDSWRHTAWQSQAVYHNAVSRETGTVMPEDGLYAEEEFVPIEESGGYVSVYARFHDDWKDRILRAFEVLGRLGLGGERSSGKGGFAVEETAPFEGFPPLSTPGGTVVLSDFVPRATDPRMGYWSTRTKFARLGGSYSTSGHPFKRPFLALEAGSCFKTEAPGLFYGHMVKDIAPGRPEVFQYGLGLALPMDGRCFKK